MVYDKVALALHAVMYAKVLTEVKLAAIKLVIYPRIIYVDKSVSWPLSGKCVSYEWFDQLINKATRKILEHRPMFPTDLVTAGRDEFGIDMPSVSTQCQLAKLSSSMHRALEQGGRRSVIMKCLLNAVFQSSRQPLVAPLNILQPITHCESVTNGGSRASSRGYNALD